MQVDACTGFAQFCIGPRPFACCFEVSFKGLLAVIPRNIKVDDNVVLRHLQIMQPARVQIGQFRAHIFPFLGRCAIFVGVLGRQVFANIIQNRVLHLEIDP